MDPRDAEIAAIKTVVTTLLASAMQENPNINAAWFAEVPISVPMQHQNPNPEDKAQIRTLIDGIVKGAGIYIKGGHQR